MFRNYLKTTIRALKKDVAYAIINTVGLAVGISCFILIGLYVRDELGFDKFHSNSDRIYRGILNYKEAGFITSTPNALLSAMKEDLPEVENAVRISFGSKAVVKFEDESVFEQESYYADPSIFEVFDFPLAIGDEGSALDVKNSLVISRYVMDKYFDGENPLGMPFQFVDDSVSYTVTGVFARIPGNSRFRFNFLRPLDAIQSKRYDPDSWSSNSGFIYTLMNQTVDTEELSEKVLEISKTRGYKSYESSEFLFEPFEDLYLKSDYSFTASGVSGDSKFIYIFSVVGVLLLLIACMNYINLSTAKAVSRSHEIGVRKIVGAQRKQIQAQFMGEAFLLTLVALVMAGGLVEYFRPTLNELAGKSITLDYLNDGFLMVSLVGIIVAVTVFAGAYPSVFVSRINPLKVLNGNGLTQGKGLLRKVLVVFQFSITLVLITSALIIQSQVSLFTSGKIGLNTDHMITTNPSVFVQNNLEVVKSEFASIPGVRAVTASPIAWGGSSFPVKSESFVEEEDNERRVSTVMAEANFIETMGIEIVQGRDFLKSIDDQQSSILVNETAMKQFNWTIGTALETLSLKENNFQYTPKKVIGVFKDLNLNQKVVEKPMIVQIGDIHSMIQIKFEPSAKEQALSAVKAKWEELETGTPFSYSEMKDVLEKQYVKEQKTGNIFNYFSGIALSIAALGLFGLSAYTAANRRKEIGIRKVLGAKISVILSLLIRGYLLLLLVALIVSVPATYYFMNDWLSDFANRTPLSWSVFGSGALVAFAILVITVGYQTIRSSLANPVNVLRDE